MVNIEEQKEKVRQSKKASYEKHKHKHKKQVAACSKRYYLANKEKIVKQEEVRRLANKEKFACARHERYIKNKEKVCQQAKLWRINNDERYRLQAKVWRQSNPQNGCAKTAKHRAAKLNATPKWADLDKIKEIYISCPKGFHVDHIIPLQGVAVCGLHVEINLQYLIAKVNQSKGNRFTDV